MADPAPLSIDLAVLTKPISTHEPAGEWLRYEGTYDQVQEARREDDESLPQGIWQAKIKRADWPKVAAICDKALRERSKDLQLAVWLAEAWLQQYGLPGFCFGLKLCTELVSKFWESMYPLLEESDPSYRLAPLEFLDRKVLTRLKRIPLTATGEDHLPLCYADWEQALRNDKLGAEVVETEIRTASFLAAAGSTPTAFYHKLHAELDALDAAAQELELAVLDKLSDRPAQLRSLRNLTKDIRTLLQQYRQDSADAELGEEGEAMPASSEHGESELSSAVASPEVGLAVGVPATHGPVKSRAEAYQRLVEAADYLMRTEPHSPVPYLVKRAVSWGNMSLLNLLRELVASDADRLAIFALLGIKSPQ